MSISKFVITDDGFGYEPIAEDKDCIRFELSEDHYIDCKLITERDKQWLEVHGTGRIVSRLNIHPVVSNTIYVSIDNE